MLYLYLCVFISYTYKGKAFIYLDLASLQQILLPHHVSSSKLISFRVSEIWSSFMTKTKNYWVRHNSDKMSSELWKYVKVKIVWLKKGTIVLKTAYITILKKN